ncbi:MAG: 23S rRNA pseudouridine synthase [Hyphomonadaceae bacterium]|nr:MAG: 23S rRNA pseudouridine synthase [Hyphomonadaceae bacterium]
MTSPITIPVRETDGEVRLDRFLRRKFEGLTQGRIEQFIRKGLIKVDGVRAKKASDRLNAGQDLQIPGDVFEAVREAKTHSANISKQDEEFLRSLIIFQDDDVIALNKPPGLAVQGGSKTVRHLDALMEVFAHPEHGRPKLVHRLDKDTSGVIVFARNPNAAAKLSKSFASRATTKIYWAICLGTPHPFRGEIRGWLKKQGSKVEPERELVRRAAHGEFQAQFAITDYEVISNAGTRASWVALKPVTGRTHQLRFHMAETGCAIAGDPKYRCDRPDIGGLSDQLHLHARALLIPHPKSGMIRLEAELPPHMKKAFDMFGFAVHEAKDPFAPFS